jgi:hypothetical protein
MIPRFLLILLKSLAAGGLALAVLWAAGALRFDFPWESLRSAVAIGWLLLVGAALVRVRPFWRAFTAVAVAWLVLLAWWLTLKPSQERDWQAEVAETPWAEIEGDRVTLHNVRHTAYRSLTDFTPQWETRTVQLSKLTGIDLFVNYWGSPWMAHPILSFQFEDAPPICFTIETRKEKGESYSAIGGLYRQFELICIAADERDVIRLRTNYRVGEESFLYRFKVSPAQARARFLEYLSLINQLRDQPRWYHALTTNCTTAMRSHRPAAERLPWDWRLLVNGKGDELLFDLGMIETGGLSFAELRQQARINEVAQKAANDEEFFHLIRQGRVGFADAPTAPANR